MENILIGVGYIFIMYLVAFLFGFLYRFLMKKFAKNSPRSVVKNINKYDRILRLLLGIGLLVLSLLTSWSPILVFFSGFCIFEAVFSWCGFYAAIGRNTCPV
jgi:uncharacterized membrane protein YesL